MDFYGFLRFFTDFYAFLRVFMLFYGLKKIDWIQDIFGGRQNNSSHTWLESNLERGVHKQNHINNLPAQDLVCFHKRSAYVEVPHPSTSSSWMNLANRHIAVLRGSNRTNLQVSHLNLSESISWPGAR